MTLGVPEPQWGELCSYYPQEPAPSAGWADTCRSWHRAELQPFLALLVHAIGRI